MRKTLPTLGVVSAGLLLAASPAHAAGTTMSSTNNTGIGNGIQAQANAQIPVNFCGNAIGLLGSATASCSGGGANANFGGGSGGGSVSMTTSGNTGLLNGIQAQALLQAPLNVCGNAIGILGTASATCTGSGANANAFGGGDQHHHMPRPPMGYHPMIMPPMVGPLAHKAVPMVHRKPVAAQTAHKAVTAAHHKAAPIRVHSKEAGLLANLLAPVTELLGPKHGYGGGMCGNSSLTSSDGVGVLNNIQAQANAQLPINISGNAFGILGTATASSQGGGANANFC